MYPSSFSKIDQRKEEGIYRQLVLTDYKSDFYSNDYLGLSRKLSCIQNHSAGSTGSRLISGNSTQAIEAEKFIANFYDSEAALIFNSGYDANIGLLSCIANRNDTILYDEYVHASIRDGIRLSLANSFSFKHNDLEDLLKKTKKAAGNIFIVVESLYSMDGDYAPINEISKICVEKGVFLIVDEAHSCGVFGLNGRGITFDYNLQNDVFARIITFGKAYGSHGAAIIGSQKLKEYLINFSRSFIYTTALPPSHYSQLIEAIKLSSHEEHRIQLRNNIELFRLLNKEKITLSEDNSPIQIIQYPSIKEIIRISQNLNKENFGVKPIFSPTVPKGKERIRICIHAFNTKSEIESLSNLLNF